MMPWLLSAAAAASALFIGTNLDDLTLLVILSASSRIEGRPKAWHIWAGQSLGITILVVLSLLASIGLTVVPDRYTGLLGLVPLGLGVYKLGTAVRAHWVGERPSVVVAQGVGGVAALTVVNGTDNIAAYSAVFRTSSPAALAVMVGVSALGVVSWCAAGRWLVSHRRISQGIERWGHWIVPAVFITIGTCLLYRARLGSWLNLFSAAAAHRTI